MTYYECRPFQKLRKATDAEEQYRGLPVDAKEAARIFANRLARKKYGKKGYCYHVRLDSWTQDGTVHHFEAFIGRDLPRAYGGGCQGHNEWLTILTRS